MRANNRYRGMLQPRQVGLPRGEMPLLLLYDIEENRIRSRVSSICLDYGLERIQFSAFFGRLSRDKREELAIRLMREVEKENVRIRIVPLTDECLAEMWEYSWWRPDAEELKEAADFRSGGSREDGRPMITVIRVTPED